ncbi:MAG: type II secretion system major pseudopilin GspG, partial [Deltaproteobacteria bacterium]
MRREGFTLIELMLVVIVIGILSSMVVPRLVNRSQQARVTAAGADINSSIPLALDLFEMDIGRYPTTQEGLAALRSNPGSLPKWKGPYLKKLPRDPWGNEYSYQSPGSHSKDYDLCSKGPDEIENTEDDIAGW